MCDQNFQNKMEQLKTKILKGLKKDEKGISSVIHINGFNYTIENPNEEHTTIKEWKEDPNTYKLFIKELGEWKRA